jgi:hypothetical protein
MPLRLRHQPSMCGCISSAYIYSSVCMKAAGKRVHIQTIFPAALQGIWDLGWLCHLLRTFPNLLTVRYHVSAQILRPCTALPCNPAHWLDRCNKFLLLPTKWKSLAYSVVSQNCYT